MYRIGELFNVEVTLDPKPIPGDWNGAGGHTNYSTKATRTAPGGYDVIVEHCEKLKKTHALHIAEYGEGNERRLTGKHEVRAALCCAVHAVNVACCDSRFVALCMRLVPLRSCGCVGCGVVLSGLPRLVGDSLERSVGGSG